MSAPPLTNEPIGAPVPNYYDMSPDEDSNSSIRGCSIEVVIGGLIPFTSVPV